MWRNLIEVLERWALDLVFWERVPWLLRLLKKPGFLRPYLCRQELGRSGATFDARGFIANARAGLLDKVKLFIDAGIDVNAPGDIGDRALIAAARQGREDVVRFLITLPRTDLNADNDAKDTALIVAAHSKQLKIVEALLADKRTNPDFRNLEDENAWIAAIRSDAIEIQQLFKDPKRKVDSRGVKTWETRRDLEKLGRFHPDAFIERCALGQIADVVKFLEAGIKVNERNRAEQAALLAAALLQDPELVDLLLKQENVEVNIRDKKSGDTPLILAARAHNTEVLRSLLQHPKIEVNAVNDAGESALLEAGRRGFEDIVAALENEGAVELDLPAKVAKWKIECLKLPLADDTFLEMVRRRRLSEIKLFLEAGIDINCGDKDGDTALLLAAKPCDTSILALLLEKSPPADVNASNEKGDTALIVAARENCPEALKLLLKHQASVAAHNHEGESALLAAARREFSTIVDELNTHGAQEPELDKKVAAWQLKRDGHWTEKGFIDAVWGNNAGLVRKFLLAGMDVNARDHLRETGLIAATRNRKVEMVEFLLNQPGIDVEARNGEGASALEIAESRKFDEIVNLLIGKHANAAPQAIARRSIHERGLRYAPETFVSQAAQGQVEQVTLFLQAGMDANAEDHAGRVALIEAARNGHKAVVEVLLAARADLDLSDRFGVTAREVIARSVYPDVADLLAKTGRRSPSTSKDQLMIAIERGDLNGVRAALAAEASADGYTDGGRPALLDAVVTERSDILAELLSHGARCDARDRDGMTSLMRAAELGYADALRLLLGTDQPGIDEVDPEGRTALILAAWQGRATVVKILIEAGANPRIRDHNGRTALIAAQTRGDPAIIKILKEVGLADDADGAQLLLAATRGEDERLANLVSQSSEDPEVPDENGNTPLALAAARGWTRSIETLLAVGARPNAANSQGDTPLMLAARAGRLAVIELLLGHDDGHVLANMKNQSGETALLQAAIAGRSLVVELLASYADQPDLGAGGRTPLVEMCYHGGGARAVAALIKVRADLNQQQVTRGKSPLMTAMLAGNTEIVQMLKDNGAWAGESEAHLFLMAKSGDDETLQKMNLEKVDLNARDRDGWTALMFAANEGHDGVVKLLLENGANADLVAPDGGETALRLAAHKGRAGSLALLINKTKRSKSSDSLALIEAAASGDGEAVRLLIQRAKAPVNGLEGRRVPLVEAAGRGHLQAVKVLLELGADPLRKTRQGVTALSAALLNNRDAVVDYLLEHGVQGDDETGLTDVRLLIAAGKPDLAEVERLLEDPEPPNLDARDERGRTALMRACEKRAEAVVELLLHAYSPDKLSLAIMARDFAQRTPLMWAAIAGNSAIVARLLKLHADPYSESKKKRTALIEACKSGRLRSVELLLNALKTDEDRHVAVNHQDDDGNSPLTEALGAVNGRTNEYAQIVSLLERHGAVQGRHQAEFLKAVQQCDLRTVERLFANVDLNKLRHKGKTPLMLAVESGCYEVAAYLIDRHADVDERGPKDATALILAAGKATVGVKDVEIVRLLLRKHADYDWTDTEESSALLYAVRNGHQKIVKNLIDAGANINQKDRTGATALSLAVERDSAQLVHSLLNGKRRLETEIWTGSHRTALTLARLRGSKTGVDEDHLPLPGHPLPTVLAKLSDIETILVQAGAREGWNEAELILAINESDTKWARHLLTKASIHTQDLTGSTPLFLACKKDEVSLARALLKHGASAEVRNNDERTPLMEAAKNHNVELVKALLKADPNLDLDAHDKEGESALLEAARSGAGEIVTLLVDRGANVRVTNRSLSTPLIEMAKHPQLEAVKTLLDRGANACGCTVNHRTAVIEAAAAGHFDVLKTLLKYLKDWLAKDPQKFLTIINAVDDESRTALDSASQGAHGSCARLLAEAGAKSVDDTQFVVFTTPQGHSYHTARCHHLRTGGKKKLTKRLLRTARRSYSLCLDCNPGQAKIDWNCSPDLNSG